MRDENSNLSGIRYSNITPNDMMQIMSYFLNEALRRNNSELLNAIEQEASKQNLDRMDYLDYLLLEGDNRLPPNVIEYRKSLENERTPLGSASPARQEFIKNFIKNERNIGLYNESTGIKRRVLKRQSTRGKKASRIKPKRQNGSKKRKGVKTRYVQGKKKKKKMNKKSSRK